MNPVEIYLVYEQDENGEFFVENLLGIFNDIDKIEKKIIKESLNHYKSIGVSEGMVYYMVVKTHLNKFVDFNNSKPIFYEIDIKEKKCSTTTKNFFTFCGLTDDIKGE